MIEQHTAGTGTRFGPRVSFVLMACLLAALIAGCKQEPPPEDKAVTWESVDGVTLHARLYGSSELPLPGLILVHDIGGDRGDWEPFARRMMQRGFRSIALDLRGHGQSVTRGDDTVRFGSFTTEDWAMAQDDLIAAKRELLKSGADPDNLFMVGAGLGGSLALRHAVNDPEIQGLIVLSPQRSTRGISIEDVVAANRRLPILFIATEGDTSSASSAEALKASTEAYCDTRIYRGSMQGTDIFASNQNVTREIIAWLAPIVK